MRIPDPSLPTVLVISSDEAAINALRGAVASAALSLIEAPSAAAALERVAALAASTIVVDDRIDDVPMPLLRRQLEAACEAPIIALGEDGARLASVLERVASGTTTIRKPLPPERLGFLHTYGSLFRRGSRSRELEQSVFGVAASDGPLLITGESGTGKKSVARAVHYLSPRTELPLVQVSCTALPPQALEQELFGGDDRIAGDTATGKLATARGGTVLIEEAGDLPLALQERLLPVLGKPGPRVIATTSKDLDTLVRAGAMVEDLVRALRANAISVPPLRERREDVPGLAEFFRVEFMERYRSETPALSEALLERLSDYAWPGNVLELENLVKRYVVLGDEQQFLAELGARSRLTPGARRRTAAAAHSGLRDIGRRAAQEAEMTAIMAALEQASWNRAEAARLLKVSYKTLLNKLNRAGISRRSRTFGHL